MEHRVKLPFVLRVGAYRMRTVERR